jgi:hypothetical protein
VLLVSSWALPCPSARTQRWGVGWGWGGARCASAGAEHREGGLYAVPRARLYSNGETGPKPHGKAREQLGIAFAWFDSTGIISPRLEYGSTIVPLHKADLRRPIAQSDIRSYELWPEAKQGS